MIHILQESTESIPPEIRERFGDTLFGSIRGLLERDTPHERWVYRKVYRYFTGGGMGQEEINDIIEAFDELLTVKQYYPDVLQPDARGYLFRGISLNSQSAINAATEMGLLDSSNYSVSKNQRMAIAHVQYNPRHKIESWTTNPNFAERMASVLSNPFFGDGEPRATDTFVILQTKQYDMRNLLFNTEFTNYLDQEYGKSDEEDEIVRVSTDPIPVEAIIDIPKEGSPMDKLLGWHQ